MIRIPAGHLPILAGRFSSQSTKRERKKAFNAIVQVVVTLGYVKRKLDITDVSIGSDLVGQGWLYLHERDSQVVTTVGLAPKTEALAKQGQKVDGTFRNEV